MKKLYEKNVITIFLIILIACLGYLNYDKYYREYREDKQQKHDQFFNEVYNNMKDLKSVSIDDISTQNSFHNLYEVDVTNYNIKKTESNSNSKMDTITYITKDEKSYYSLPENAVNYSINTSETKSFFNYNSYINIIKNVKNYTHKNGIYTFPNNIPSSNEFYQRFLKYKTINVKIKDNYVEYITAKYEDKTSAANIYEKITFSNYDNTNVDIPTEILARID